MQVQVDRQTQTILAYGVFTADIDDPTIEIYDLPESEVAKLEQPGVKRFDPEDGQILVEAASESPLLTLEEAKKKVHLELKTYATALRDRFIAPLSAGEAASWLRKEEEATRLQIDGIESNAPFLRAEASVRGVSVTALAAKVLENAASLKYLEAQIAGTRGRHDDAIDQLTTVEAVLAYDWSTGWVAAD